MVNELGNTSINVPEINKTDVKRLNSCEKDNKPETTRRLISRKKL